MRCMKMSSFIFIGIWHGPNGVAYALAHSLEKCLVLGVVARLEVGIPKLTCI